MTNQMVDESAFASRSLTNILLVLLILCVLADLVLTRESDREALKQQTANANLTLVSLQAIEQHTAKAPVTRWEYIVYSPDDVELMPKINQLGTAGWEIVTARRATSPYGGEASYEMILKRPLPGVPEKR